MQMTEGIILKTNKYQENSKIAYILTSEGISSFLIRASCSYTSKNYQYSQELSFIEFDYVPSKKNSFDIITTGMVKNIYQNIKNDQNKLITALDNVLLAYKFSEHVNNNQNLYELLLYTLNGINDYQESNNNNNNYYYYTIIFKLKLLFLLGLGPNMSKCSTCGKDNVQTFSVLSGGMVCDKCHTMDSIKGDYLEIIKILYLGKLDKLTKEVISLLPDYLDSINLLINRYYEHYLSFKFIK